LKSKYRIYDEGQFYFITSTVVDWIPIFIDDQYFNILIKAISFSQKEKGLNVHAYVLLDNHFHMIISGQCISNIMGSIKSFTAKQIIDILKKHEMRDMLEKFRSLKAGYKTESEFQIWQEGFHPQLISSTEMFEQKLEYIHFNPVRRGIVNNPVDYYYSSAGFYYEGIQGPLEVEILA
jgi:putative transposase